MATATTSNGYGGIAARKIEIGAAVIGIWPSGKWALADWRTTSAPAHGRILFVYRCDEWNVANVVTGSSAHELGELMRGMDHSQARELARALTRAEMQRVAYTKPDRQQQSC